MRNIKREYIFVNEKNNRHYAPDEQRKFCVWEDGSVAHWDWICEIWTEANGVKAVPLEDWYQVYGKKSGVYEDIDIMNGKYKIEMNYGIAVKYYDKIREFIDGLNKDIKNNTHIDD